MGVPVPVAGVDFPGSLAEVRAWFPDDDACLDYLAWLRWGEFGFVCHLCGDVDGWQSSRFSWECAGCKARITPTAGTIFHRTRTPLTVWFEAGWLVGADPGSSPAYGETVTRTVHAYSESPPSTSTSASPAFRARAQGCASALPESLPAWTMSGSLLLMVHSADSSEMSKKMVSPTRTFT